jgi:hypothetical protein
MEVLSARKDFLMGAEEIMISCKTKQFFIEQLKQNKNTF